VDCQQKSLLEVGEKLGNILMLGYLLTESVHAHIAQHGHRQEMPRFTGQDFPGATQEELKFSLFGYQRIQSFLVILDELPKIASA